MNTLSNEYRPKVSKSVINKLNKRMKVPIDLTSIDIRFRTMKSTITNRTDKESETKSKVKEEAFNGTGTIINEIIPRMDANIKVELII